MVIYPIPAPPLNTTSAYFCSDTPITLQASGGLNNIWYESESAKSSLSTASALSMKAIQNTSEVDSLLVRFASIKINDCESARTPVAIRVKPSLKLRPLLPISLTGEKTISTFETLALNGTPPYRILYNSTAKNPLGPFSSSGYFFRTVIDSLGCLAKDTTEVYYVRNGPIVNRLTAQMETHCLTSNYRIRVNGCPLKTSAIAGSKRYESSTADFALSGGQYTFLCNDGESDTLFLNLPVLKQPTSLVRKSFTSSICEADSASMSLIVDPSVHFIGWELNGHLFSTEKLLTGLLPAGVYQSVIEENGCYYRSEKIVLERKANPPPPRLEKSGAYFIRAKSTGLLEWLIDQTKLTDTASFRKITEGREFYARAKWLHKSLACFSPYSTVYYVDKPATYEFAAYPNPNQGVLFIEIAYETENAQLYLFDLKGKLIDAAEIKNSSRRMDWDISHLPAGTYVLRLISDGVSQEKAIRKSL